MRTKYTLWKASNGWLLVPEGNSNTAISANDVQHCVIFKTLKEFADFKPKRERKSRERKAVSMAVTPEDATHWSQQPQHTKD